MNKLFSGKQYLTIGLLALLFFGAGIRSSEPADNIFKGQIGRIMRRFPEARITSKRDQILRFAKRELNADELKKFTKYLENDNNSKQFHEIRLNESQKARRIAPPRGKDGKILKAVVSGRSINGMMQALQLQRIGYDVTIVDSRADHTRNIQWAIRQSLLDNLESMDPELAKRFRDKVAADLKTSIHIGTNNQITSYDVGGGVEGDATRLENINSGADMLKEPSVMTTEARVFEDVFEQYLSEQKDPKLSIVTGKTEVGEVDSKGRHSVKIHKRDGSFVDMGKPTRVVIAEGANSTNASKLGIDSYQTTPHRLQVAGVVESKGNGEMAKHYRLENGEQMVSYTMETDGSNRMWVVADIHADSITPDPVKYPLTPSDRFKVGTVNYTREESRLRNLFEIEERRLLDKEFRRLAEHSLRKPKGSLESVRVSGPFDGASGPMPFNLDQKISKKAYSGTNLILVGDSVGNATPTVGGGMQMAVTSHALRVREMDIEIGLIEDELRNELITEEQAKIKRSEIVKSYSNNVVGDTLAWHRQGVPDMYLYVQDMDEKELLKRLPGEAPFAKNHNKRIAALEKEFKKADAVTVDDLIKLTGDEAEVYYRVPREEVFDASGKVLPDALKNYKEKLKMWAKQDYLRLAFDDSLKSWKSGKVDEPLSYMNRVLPRRPWVGLKSIRGRNEYSNNRKPREVSKRNLCIVNKLKSL